MRITTRALGVCSTALLWCALSAALVGCGSEETPSPADAAVGPTASSSSFDKDNDGWKIVGDAKEAEAIFKSTGGNPGGLIAGDDKVQGGIWYFKAPARYVGDKSSYVGRKLLFELTTTSTANPFDAADVILIGAGKTIGYDASPDPSTTGWTKYSVPLANGGWRAWDTQTKKWGAAVSEADFSAVMAGLTELRLRGEFNTGADTGSLDNVVFGAP